MQENSSFLSKLIEQKWRNLLVVILRQDQAQLTLVKDTLKAVFSELIDLDADLAVNMTKWLKEETTYYKQHLKELALDKAIKILAGKNDPDSLRQSSALKKERKCNLPTNYPSSLVKGDIICINYGVGMGDELSDWHYGIVLHRRGRTFLVAPLTSTPQPHGQLNIHLNNLGLPDENASGSYVNYQQIRYVHYRRIENINGIANGRLHIDTSIANNVINNFAIIANNWQ